MNKKILITIIIVLVLIAASVILVFGYYFIQNQKKINVEDFVRSYLTKTQNFDGLDGRIEVTKIKISFSEGFFKNLWEVELFMKEKTRDFGNHMIEEANNLKKMNISDDFNKYLDEEIKTIEEQRSNIHKSISNISIETLEKNDSSARVRVNYEINVKDFNGEQKIDQQGVYVLDFINGNWKIVDFIDKDGAWSETMDYAKEKKDFIASLDEEEKNFDKMVSEVKSLAGKSAEIVTTGQTQTLLSVVWQETFESGSQWSGQRSGIAMQSPSNAVAKMTGAVGSDGYLFKKITVPSDVYYMSYEMQNEKSTIKSFLTVTFGNEIISYQNLNKIDDGMRKVKEIFIGDMAGKTDDLLFTVNQVGNEEPSVLIDNIKFYKIILSLP